MTKECDKCKKQGCNTLILFKNRNRSPKIEGHFCQDCVEEVYSEMDELCDVCKKSSDNIELVTSLEKNVVHVCVDCLNLFSQKELKKSIDNICKTCGVKMGYWVGDYFLEREEAECVKCERITEEKQEITDNITLGLNDFLIDLSRRLKKAEAKIEVLEADIDHIQSPRSERYSEY